MKKQLYNTAGALLLLFLLALLPSQARADQPLAYLDPGTGSYIFQLLIAGLVGTGFALKLFWGQIKALVVSIFTKNKDNDQQP